MKPFFRAISTISNSVHNLSDLRSKTIMPVCLLNRFVQHFPRCRLWGQYTIIFQNQIRVAHSIECSQIFQNYEIQIFDAIFTYDFFGFSVLQGFFQKYFSRTNVPSLNGRFVEIGLLNLNYGADKSRIRTLTGDVFSMRVLSSFFTKTF